MGQKIINGNADGTLDPTGTATAQSGRYVQGREVLNTYFAGVYPFDHPRYAIVVMRENGTSGAADCCPVFRRIVSNLP